MIFIDLLDVAATTATAKQQQQQQRPTTTTTTTTTTTDNNHYNNYYNNNLVSRGARTKSTPSEISLACGSWNGNQHALPLFHCCCRCCWITTVIKHRGSSPSRRCSIQSGRRRTATSVDDPSICLLLVFSN